MPGVGRFPCSSCHYVAGNRRMLARHVVLIHSEKSFKCPVCPFRTRYAANWYRHKRDLHGLTKVNNCEVCGIVANTTEELARHKEAEHPEHLQLEKFEDKYAKEKIRLGIGAAEEATPHAPDVIVEETDNSPLAEQSFLDDEDIFTPEVEITIDEEEDDPESITFSLPLNGLFNGEECKEGEEQAPVSGNKVDDSLGPLKVKRSYHCQCGLLTSNPREYLYHQKLAHGEKINVYECKYCIYASKHIQKLQRHCNLVHRALIAKDPEYKKQLEASKEKKRVVSKPIPTPHILQGLPPIAPGPPPLTLPHPPTQGPVNPGGENSSTPVIAPFGINPEQGVFKCPSCPFQTLTKVFLIHHQKTVHKVYECAQCGYITVEKDRYAKHVKYHSLPKMQCEFCFFKSAYKWNMDRHMKNHENGAAGEFHCTACNFTTATKQSFKMHVTNHHNNESVEDFVDKSNMNGQDESLEWEDIGMEEEKVEVEAQNREYSTNFISSYLKKEKKRLSCRYCEFTAAWPFELRRHEDNHRSQKKHPCPICGMRFELIAWLTKHLRRVHPESSQAKNIAAAFDLVKPGGRRRTGKDDHVLPMVEEVLKQNNVSSTTINSITKPPEPKRSMLSTLLNKPLQPILPATMKPVNVYKSKTFASVSNMSRQLRLSNYYDKGPGSNESASASNMAPKPKTVPTCNICGYKTRWISELQRHMRVHSQEKPFRCPKCKYHCKWKGDLNRHLMKYHGIKVPSNGKKPCPPRFRIRRPSVSQNFRSDSQHVGYENNKRMNSGPSRGDPDTPLDLTLTKDAFPNYSNSSDNFDPYEFESFSASNEEIIVDVETVPENDPPPFKPPVQHVRDKPLDPPATVSTKRKYQCPFCEFATTTASRFHVHIVQHYNRRPFMCSVCGYNSNWEWDITKHIRLKGCRDEFLNKACVLLTDESGRRNYEKYEKYLVDINAPPPSTPSSKPPEHGVQSRSGSRHAASKAASSESTQKPCSYDFRNIGSNFEDTPENIVVTPDINMSDNAEANTSQRFYRNQMTQRAKAFDSKWFFCKHCNFKHATKRVVISHLSIHAGIKPFRCRACGITSNWRHVIVRHVKDTHNGYMNEVEDRISYTQEGYSLRLTSVSSGDANAASSNNKPHVPQFGCKICPYKCDKEFYIKSHMKQHRPREGAVYRCNYCPYFVKFKKTLVRHTKLHCPTEDVGFNEGVDVDELESEASPNEEYNFYHPQMGEGPDDSIAISFDSLNQFSEGTSPQKLKRHICESCPYKTDNKTQYLYHKQFHRPNPSAPFKCSVCSYWATMQHLLTQHMKVHNEPSEAESEYSPKMNGNRGYVEKALPPEDDWAAKMSVVYVKRGDAVVKMFKCKFCPMMNKKKANVRVHQKMHGVIVNNGKFACSYCDYQCLNQGGLTNHLKIHQKVPEKEEIMDNSSYELTQKRSDMSDEVSVPRKTFFSYFCMKCPALFKSSNDLEIHSKFHGSSLPFPCSFCDYRARHKPHLAKHLTVHTPEYEAKRNASQGPPVGYDGENSSNSDPMLSVTDIPLVKKIDQMLLLEAMEMRSALKKTGEAASVLQRCMICSAPFIKASTLSYHISLHSSDGEFKCTQCDYAVSRMDNLNVHSQVHPKKKVPVKPKKPPLRSFSCPNCPAVFYKPDRFERHLSLHGKNYKFQCQHCDYSVRFAANLIKHRNLHAAHAKEKMESEGAELALNAAPSVEGSPATQPLAECSNFLEGDEKKLMYLCDRCPYSQARKDAVQSHQRRHWLGDGFKCPYCDYTSMQSGFVQSHIKLHIQPTLLFPAQAFIKFDSFKIIAKDEDDNETLLFDDQEMLKAKHSEGKRKRRFEDGYEKRKIPKLGSDSEVQDSNSSDFIHNLKVPVVVLSDILSNEEDLQKWAPKLRIPKLKITKCPSSSSEKSYSKINVSYDAEDKSKPKPSLVVKISKLENCNKYEKAMYSVSTKDSSELSSVKTNEPSEKTELPDEHNPVTSSTVSESFEVCAQVHAENTPDNELECEPATANSPVCDKNSETVCPSNDNEIIGESPAVPENEVLPDQVLTNTQDLILNGESDSHLLNVKLPEEIEVKL